MKKLTVLTMAALLASTTAISAHAESVSERARADELRKTSNTTWSETQDKIEKKFDSAVDKTEKSLNKAKANIKEQHAAANTNTSASNSITAPVTSQEFIQRAIYSNNFSAEISDELDDSKNKSVKELAEKIKNDHDKAENGLEDAIKKSANKDAFERVEPEDDLDAQQKAQLDQIKQTDEGAARDKLYISTQLDAHRESVKLYREYAANGDDAELKNYAKRTLPVLEAHLKHIEGVSKNIQ